MRSDWPSRARSANSLGAEPPGTWSSFLLVFRSCGSDSACACSLFDFDSSVTADVAKLFGRRRRAGKRRRRSSSSTGFVFAQWWRVYHFSLIYIGKNWWVSKVYLFRTIFIVIFFKIGKEPSINDVGPFFWIYNPPPSPCWLKLLNRLLGGIPFLPLWGDVVYGWPLI